MKKFDEGEKTTHFLTSLLSSFFRFLFTGSVPLVKLWVLDGLGHSVEEHV